MKMTLSMYQDRVKRPLFVQCSTKAANILMTKWSFLSLMLSDSCLNVLRFGYVLLYVLSTCACLNPTFRHLWVSEFKFLLLSTDRSPHNLISSFCTSLCPWVSPHSQIAPSKPSLKACLDAAPALCMCIYHVYSLSAGSDSRMGAPKSTQVIGVLALVHTPELRPNTALSSQRLQFQKCFCSDGVKAWVQMDWMGKYTARIIISVQDLHTVALCELKTYTNLWGFFKKMKKTHS